MAVGLIYVQQHVLAESVIELRGAKVITLFLFLLLPLKLKGVVVGLFFYKRFIQFRFGLPIRTGKKLLLKAAQVI